MEGVVGGATGDSNRHYALKYSQLSHQIWLSEITTDLVGLWCVL